MSTDADADIDRLPFLEYARRMLAETDTATTFDELVLSPLTELQVEAQYGEETAINVGIARDPEDSTWWKEDYAQMRRAIAAARRVSTDAVVSPGETLRAELAARGLSQRKLAKAMGRPVNAINEIVLGKKSLTPKTALELERVLEVPAHIWVRLEADYRLALARAETTEESTSDAPLPGFRKTSSRPR